MSIKTRGVSLEREETAEVRVVFGQGKRVHGTVTGLPPAPMRMVMLRRPGGPAPEDVNPLDTEASVESAKYQAGIGMIDAEGVYEIPDVEPGRYILEIPVMPDDPTDIAAYAGMDRTPRHRREITVKEDDLEVDIEVK